jgi:K+-sensing histidine kinase KdpD
MHIPDYIAVLKRTKLLEWATATAVSLAMLIVVTAILWWVKFALPGALHHPVFFYLVPTAILAMVYGVIDGALFAVAAFVCSAFLLYDPIYSFRVADVHALGELFWFLITALVGVKCVEELRRRSDKF